jgi:hypothetical protein
MRFIYARYPDSNHPIIIENLLEFVEDGQQEAVTMLIEMLRDLHQEGLASRFVKKLSGIRVWELKTKSRGGQKGGARVYFYPTKEAEVLIINAEIKIASAASPQKLKEAVSMIIRYEQGLEVT